MSDTCQCKPGCTFQAPPGEPYALRHDPRPERQAERMAVFAQQGRKGQATQAANRLKRKELGCRLPVNVDLETSKGRIRELRRLLLSVEQSGGSATSKATAIARLVSEARAEMRGVELEEAYAELRQLFIQHNPGAAHLLPPRLRSVK